MKVNTRRQGAIPTRVGKALATQLAAPPVLIDCSAVLTGLWAGPKSSAESPERAEGH